jgi:Rps23 Pro-64 3,4-dihydroxylase Tpa1-like proline 4-hydroxylase
MEIEYYTEPYVFCVIRNYLTDYEIITIKKELTKLQPQLKDPLDTGTATTKNGNVLKQNKGMFIHNSPITHIGNDKLDKVIEQLIHKHWIYNYFNDNKVDSTLVTLYKQGDYYNEHRDDSVLTSLYYIWDEPKPFKGGDLLFGTFKVPIDNNCIVIFPSCINHSVSQVTEGYGRWVITQFISKKTVNDNIYIYDGFLSFSDFSHVKKTIDSGHWKFENYSNPSSKDIPFWIMDLKDDPVFSSILKKKIEKVTCRNFKLEEVYANGQTRGQNGSFHVDTDDDNSWTFILYINDTSDNDEWGGETQFKVGDTIKVIKPVMNRGVLFKANIFHRGMAPSPDNNNLRVTVAWKLSQI